MNDREISQKLITARLNVLHDYPFFGRLLLKLSFGLAECGTAFTDMRRIVFDPQFVLRISMRELEIVLVHEILHCVLKHCVRGKSKQHFIYNVACDIVVNSTILEMYDTDEIKIDGHSIMHLAPNFDEGREHTAEEVYRMLLDMLPEDFDGMYAGGNLDCHDVWENTDGKTLEDLWNHHIKDAAKATSQSGGIPGFLERYIAEIDHSPRTNWRQVLHDFIQFDKSDYEFLKPDTRNQSDVLLPSFCDDIYGAKVDNIWFFVDTSGSVSDEAVSVAYHEVKNATEQINNVSGVLWFFDAVVYEPYYFDTLEDILAVKPKGGGGTSFKAVFDKLKEYEDDKPNAIVIITDGYDEFPKEESALGVPVIWLIVDSEVIVPWGVYTYISTKD